MGRFSGQVAVVTGGASGLGLAIAGRLASEGANIVLWDIDTAGFDPAVAGFKPLGITTIDVTGPDAVEAATQDVISRFGRIDVMVNNAGITGPVEPVEAYALDDWMRVLTLDLTAVFLCCRACIPHMKSRGYGRIVNVASIGGKEPVPGICAYGAAKAGVIGFTKTIARELAGTGVLANCIAPAMVETDLLKQMTPGFVEAGRNKIPLGRFITADEVATAAAFTASPECSFATGFTFDVSGGRATY
ncbi:SDR family NAD(P)-dependent oxidoreductase [Mesorhizobium xinjiangense]|uniref:SDR family NAD(P)-dependent oxidoreductase n=1 Tax=Mesorhizobium xinjiangense TaxID=2678685 RepID=UPI0012ED11F0|nr:SDR family NAD(P)-dependent oxidoreductase [Mesorhizobium xinjiangense]